MQANKAWILNGINKSGEEYFFLGMWPHEPSETEKEKAHLNDFEKYEVVTGLVFVGDGGFLSFIPDSRAG